MLKSPEKARKVYSTALDSLPSSKTLLEVLASSYQLINVYIVLDPLVFIYLVVLFSFLVMSM